MGRKEKSSRRIPQQRLPNFQKILENSPQHVALTDVAGNVLYSNGKVEHILGYPPEEYRKMDLRDAVHPEDLSRMSDVFRKVLLNPDEPQMIHIRSLAKHGDYVWTEIAVRNLLAETGVEGILFSMCETNALLKGKAEQLEQEALFDKKFREMEAALIHSERLYRSIVEDQSDLICRYDADCRLHFVNQAYADLFGQKAKDMLGQSFLQYIPAANHEASLAHIRSLTKERPLASYEHEAIMPDGSKRWHLWTDRAIFDEFGTIIEYQGIGRDITEQKRAEEAENRERIFRDALLGSLTALSMQTDVDSIMKRILTEAAEVVPCDGGSIFLFEGDTARIEYSRGISEEAVSTFNKLRLSIEQSLLKRSMQGSFILADTHAEKNWHIIKGAEWIRCSLYIPIFVEGQVIGCLSSDSAVVNYFSEDDLSKMEAFALYVGIALERVFYVQRLEEEVARRTDEAYQIAQELASILDNSFEPILFLSENLGILRVNPAYRHLMQLNGFAPLSLNLKDAVSAADHAKLGAFVAERKIQHDAAVLELTMLRHDGSEFEAELSFGYVVGINPRFVVTLRNISERKAYERQLKFHASLQDNVQDAVIVTDMDYRLRGWNKAAEAIYGWKEEEVVGKVGAEILKTEFMGLLDRDHYLRELQEKQAVTGEYIQHHRDGRPIYIYASTSVIKDKDGKPFGIISINRDISERYKMELALNVKIAEELEFQQYLKALHDVNIELSKIEDLDEFYKQAIILGREHFDFERLALFLYDEATGGARGTYGTDAKGNLSDENHLFLAPLNPKGVLARTLASSERFVFDEETHLSTASEATGRGWNAGAGLWTGEGVVGWLVADNALSQIPAKKAQLDILALYAANLGTLYRRKKISLALRESEARYRIIIDHISDMVVSLDLDATYRYVSPASKLILGYEPEELVGKSGFDLIYAEDLPKMQEAAVRALNQREDFQPLPVRFIHKEGHHVWLETTGRTIFADTGEPLGFTTTSRDISERMTIEAALRESEERFRLLMEDAPIAIVVSNKAGKIIMLNAEAEELLDYQRFDLIGKPIETLVPEARRKGHEAKRHAYTEKPHKRTMGNVEELFVRRKDGGLFWADIQLSYIELENDLLVMAFMQDISERKLAEESLLLYSQEVQDLYDKAPCGYHSLDANGLFVAINDTELQWLGYEREEILGRMNFSEILTEASRDSFRQNFPIFKEQGWIKDVEFELVRKDGSTFFAALSATAILDENGHFIMSRSTMFDISDRKAAQKALEQALIKEKELSELKSRFVAMASHEFRTPLAVIKSSSDLVIRYGEKQGFEWSRSKLGKVNEQIEHLTHIMNDILDLGRLQSGKLEFKPSMGNLADLCRKLLDEFRNRPEVQHEFIESISADIPDFSFDEALMRQVINNLLSNAAKYSPDAAPIDLRLRREGVWVVLEVADKGIGIPEADKPHLFEPFHRAANVGAIQGTGMGLSITKEIAEKHSGTIAVESAMGKGTRFILRLPLNTM